MNLNDPLLKLREKINLINKEIIFLLSKRKTLTIEIAKIKLMINHSIRDENREKKMFESLVDIGEKHGIKKKYILDIFNIIINQSISTQKRFIQKKLTIPKKNISISFLGPKGSYSYYASHEYGLKKNKKILKKNCFSFKEIFKNVKNNLSDIGILPIENSCTGSILEVYDLLGKYDLYIIEELKIPIQHCLLGISEANFNTIKMIYSHTQPFQQCEKFIKLFSNWKINYTESTAAAMEKVSSLQSKSIAAIGSPIGSSLYNLKIIKENISNRTDNSTKFIVISKKKFLELNNSSKKIMIMFTIKKKSKNFISLFSLFNKLNISINKFELFNILNSTNEKKMFLEIKVYSNSFKMEKFLEEIKKFTNNFKIIGYYKSL
ncbi:chorismate mutase [Buchnera aphidicola]|uniref:chorismate mutase n=1 Tax=Buchnera aphidicola TaxID=9 RepID=UPI0031B6F01C